MKDFYSICEPWSNDIEFYKKGKRKTVLKTIKPICEAFGISDYDYILNDEQERLVIEGTQIDCRYNSIVATVRELIVFIFVKCGCGWDKSVAIKAQTFNQLINQLKCCWIEEE